MSNNENNMARLQDLFDKKKKGVLNVYFTAGFPELNSTVEIMKTLQSEGVDIIELGMPYSDPLADGPVIQESSAIALKNGMSIATLFEQLKTFRKDIHIPVILMGYMNPVLQFGFEKFCQMAAAVGIDGLILPDLPPFEFEHGFGEIMKKHGLDFIFLVTPETAEERVKKLDQLSTGFLYAVSSSSTTGKEKNMDAVVSYVDRLNSYQLKNPILVGFGIKDKASFELLSGHANGGIIGSAFINRLQSEKDYSSATKTFIRSILQ
jgi:tryptophan synthase alpha chain